VPDNNVRAPNAAEIIAQDSIRRSNFAYPVLLLTDFIFLVLLLTPVPVRAQPIAARPLRQDESCLACHGEAGMKSDRGKSLAIDPAKHAASVHGAFGCTDCHTTIKEYSHPPKYRRCNARPATSTKLRMRTPAFMARWMYAANPAMAILTG